MLKPAVCQVLRLVLCSLMANSVLLAQTTTLRSTTQLVEIDTVAVDSHGKPVTDLKAEEIRLFEDGRERPLSHFSFERVAPIDAKAVERIHKLAQVQRPGVYANFTPATAIVPPNGCTVLLLDWMNTPAELQPSAEQELKSFIENVDLSKPLAIYSLDSSLHQLQSFTSDRHALLANVQKYGLHSTNLQPEKRATHNLDSERTDFLVMNSVSALLNIAGSLEWIQGHKSLIWLSGSFPAGLTPSNRLLPPREAGASGWSFGERRDYSDVITELSHVLSANNIAVYPVDAQGLQGNITDASQYSIRFYISPIMESITQRQEAMRDVADLTGGRPFYNHNDIGHELSEAYHDANTFYALAFTPAKTKPDGKMHSVRVECRRAGIQLRYRRSYFADDRQAPIRKRRAELEALVRTPGRSIDGLPLMAELNKVENDRLNLWLDGNSLSLPAAEEAPLLLVDIGIATFDDHGILLQQNYAEMKIKIGPEQFHQVQMSGLSQTLQFARSREAALVRVAVRDLGSGKVGTLELPLK
jgi:VWFA-related protein